MQAPVDAAFACLNGWLDYAGSAVAHSRVTPLDFAEDALRWWEVATDRRAPSWSTSHRVMRSWPEAELLDFSTAESGTPTLILPPQAGHASTIVDYSAGQSQVRTARTAGLERAFVLSWQPATDQTASSSIEDYIAILDEAVELLGGRINLVGDCQGGWLATIYAALRPGSVAALAVAGAPIDFHAGHSAIQEWVRSLSRNGELRFYEHLVGLGDGNHLGANQILGFKMLEPAEEISRLAGLWGHVHDTAYAQRYTDFENWFAWGQDLPGAFYLWIVEHLFIGNELVHGELHVDGQPVDLGSIDCPVFMLAGRTDHITPAEQMFALADYVGTPSRDQRQLLVDAGHLGLFMGHAALEGAWTDVFTALAAIDSEH
ncbi:alpha/beta hydrolase [Flexivirga caeni]|uniref:Alpha/beta hydrolase n=1 Tax=Flexivirga caeni TaxID=2294115 RepID=A0A3M9M272_9MICO|nr:alpha/beta hydrolase [Flexivirga caeni]